MITPFQFAVDACHFSAHFLLISSIEMQPHLFRIGVGDSTRGHANSAVIGGIVIPQKGRQDIHKSMRPGAVIWRWIMVCSVF